MRVQLPWCVSVPVRTRQCVCVCVCILCVCVCVCVCVCIPDWWWRPAGCGHERGWVDSRCFPGLADHCHCNPSRKPAGRESITKIYTLCTHEHIHIYHNLSLSLSAPLSTSSFPSFSHAYTQTQTDGQTHTHMKRSTLFPTLTPPIHYIKIKKKTHKKHF